MGKIETQITYNRLDSAFVQPKDNITRSWGLNSNSKDRKVITTIALREKMVLRDDRRVLAHTTNSENVVWVEINDSEPAKADGSSVFIPENGFIQLGEIEIKAIRR